MSKPFNLYPQSQLPAGFEYPIQLQEVARSGEYADIYPWWFADASGDAGELFQKLVHSLGKNRVPFAKVDDDRADIACFDATDTSGDPPVHMLVLDDSGRTYGYRNFAAWLGAAQADAAGWQAWIKGR